MKIKLFTHTDLDGVGCAVLANLVFGSWSVDVEYCDYSNADKKVSDYICTREWEKYDRTYITDISISDNLAIIINELNDQYNVRLFDHHKTAEYLNEYDWCEVRVNDTLSKAKTCGTAIFFRHLIDLECFVDFNPKRINNIVRFVKIVRAYDTWKWTELGNEGIVCKRVNDLFYIYGREKFIRWITRQIHTFVNPKDICSSWDGCYFPDFSEDDKVVLEQKQKEIDAYVDEKNEQLIRKIDESGYVYGTVFAERYFSELGNRLCKLHPDMDYVVLIDISKGKVSYRTIKDNIDLGGEIAHSYGGGGHKKAAGSTFDKEMVVDSVIGIIFKNEEEA